jgi:hypothetical protein
MKLVGRSACAKLLDFGVKATVFRLQQLQLLLEGLIHEGQALAHGAAAVTRDRPRGNAAEMMTRARQTPRFVIYCPVLSIASTKGTAPMDKVQVEELSSKHAALHAMIDEEEHRPHPDEDLLHRLKKERLRIKDELVGH